MNDWMEETRADVDERLRAFFERERAHGLARSPASIAMVDAVVDLTMRGGKRLRALVLAAAAHAAGGAGRDAIATAGAAFELLQTYLLVHDDWMDGDAMRRGGPSVHAHFRALLGDTHLGDSVGILAGDLASTYAWELALAVPFAEGRRDAGLGAFVALQKDVYFGQHLDVTGDADVLRMHDLKTGSYSVRGPVALALALAAASPAASRALLDWADPLGLAFQLRDDLLGTFGVPGTTGKPGDDLVHGKRNAVVREAERVLDGEDRVALVRVLEGHADDASAVCALLERRGVRATIETRIEVLLEASEAALRDVSLRPEGVVRLREIAGLLVRRAL